MSHDEESARAILLDSHPDAAEAALLLGKWLIANLGHGGTTQAQFRDDLVEGLRRGAMDE